MRMATPSPNRRDSPRQRGVGVDGVELDVHGLLAPAGGGAVHHVVVDEGEGVEQLEGGTGVDDRGVVGRAAGSDERPVAEGRSQPLAAGQHEAAERVASGASRSGSTAVHRRVSASRTSRRRASTGPATVASAAGTAVDTTSGLGGEEARRRRRGPRGRRR